MFWCRRLRFPASFPRFSLARLVDSVGVLALLRIPASQSLLPQSLRTMQKADNTAKAVLSAQSAAELTRQLDADKIGALSARVETLLRQNDHFRQQLEKSESQTHEFVTYFQREMEIKDEIIVQLNAEFERTKLTLEKELQTERSERDAERKRLLSEKHSSESSLTLKLKEAEEELAQYPEADALGKRAEMQVEAFRDTKNAMTKTIADLNAMMAAMEKVHADDMLRQERKFLADKAKEQRQLRDRRDEIVQEARAEAQATLDADTRRIVYGRNASARLHVKAPQTSSVPYPLPS
eukprot:scaffold3726_cov270-Pinguiococcus_pyrenoidosus.AAC.6